MDAKTNSATVKIIDGILHLPMSHFNRIQNPVLECAALIGARDGEVIIIRDESETREHKNFPPLISLTMASLLSKQQTHEHTSDDTEEQCDNTTQLVEGMFFSSDQKNWC